MQELSAEGRRIVEATAQRHGVGADAALILLHALAAGGGRAAQFNHPDLGGMGQWSQGGMIMIGDMFNHGLKAKVDALCRDLAELLRDQPLAGSPGSTQLQSQSQGFGLWRGREQGSGGRPAEWPASVSLFVPVSGGSQAGWWPAELGVPSSTGAQNDLRYAWFTAARRLAIQRQGEVTLYDTGDHRIGGFSQQQSGDQSLTFTSQHGVVRVADLPVVAHPPIAARPAEPAGADAAPQPAGARPPADDVFAKIEKLAELRQKGILSEEEFTAAKTGLLSRL